MAIPYTKEDFEKKKAELQHLKHIVQIELPKRIAEAKEHGDLKENSEFHAAIEEQQKRASEMLSLEEQLSQAYIIDKDALTTDTVSIASIVELKERGEVRTCKIVAPEEKETLQGLKKISVISPVGKALLGKKVGDVVEVQVLNGIRQIEICSITF